MERWPSQSGFTLTELMVGLAMGAIVALAIATLIRNVTRDQQSLNAVADVDAETRQLSDIVQQYFSTKRKGPMLPRGLPAVPGLPSYDPFYCESHFKAQTDNNLGDGIDESGEQRCWSYETGNCVGDLCATLRIYRGWLANSVGASNREEVLEIQTSCVPSASNVGLFTDSVCGFTCGQRQPTRPVVTITKSTRNSPGPFRQAWQKVLPPPAENKGRSRSSLGIEFCVARQGAASTPGTLTLNIGAYYYNAGDLLKRRGFTTVIPEFATTNPLIEYFPE